MIALIASFINANVYKFKAPFQNRRGFSSFNQIIYHKRILNSYFKFCSNLKDRFSNYDRIIYIFTVFKKRRKLFYQFLKEKMTFIKDNL